MSKIAFHIATPSAQLYCADADMVLVPASEGDMGIMAGHSPMITLLRAGTVVVQDGDTKTRVFIDGGFMEITPDAITILAESGAMVSDLDADTVKTKLVDAESAYANDASDSNKTTLDIAKAKHAELSNPQYV